MRIYIERKIKKKCDKYICSIFELIYLSKNQFNKITVDNLDQAGSKYLDFSIDSEID